MDRKCAGSAGGSYALIPFGRVENRAGQQTYSAFVPRGKTTKQKTNALEILLALSLCLGCWRRVSSTCRARELVWERAWDVLFSSGAFLLIAVCIPSPVKSWHWASSALKIYSEAALNHGWSNVGVNISRLERAQWRRNCGTKELKKGKHASSCMQLFLFFL